MITNAQIACDSNHLQTKTQKQEKFDLSAKICEFARN